MSGGHRLGRLVFLGATACAAAGAARSYRRWHLRWGATDAEVTSAMPGDAQLWRADFAATRALTIDAPPDAVWPWLVQVGVGRAGFYSYDLLDNRGRPSATTILTEYQHPAIGDVAAPMAPGDDPRTYFRVGGLAQNRWLLWAKRDSTWCWQLTDLGGRTRLVTRVRCRFSGPLAPVWVLLMEIGDFPMMRRMLLGIRERAERLTTERTAGASTEQRVEDPA